MNIEIDARRLIALEAQLDRMERMLTTTVAILKRQSQDETTKNEINTMLKRMWDGPQDPDEKT